MSSELSPPTVEEAAQLLRTSPDMAEHLDRLYGAGYSASVLGGTPSDAVDTETPDEGVIDMGLGILGQIPRGVGEALDSAANLAQTVTGFDGYMYIDNNGFQFLSKEEYDAKGGIEVADIFPEPEGIVEGLVNDISQGAAGLVGVGKVIKGSGWMFNLVRGGAAEFLAFQGQEGNILDFAREFGIEGSVIDYLTGKEDDGELEARFKNTIANAVPFAVLDAFVFATRSLKANKTNPDAALELAEKAQEAAAKGITEAEDSVVRATLGDEKADALKAQREAARMQEHQLSSLIGTARDEALLQDARALATRNLDDMLSGNTRDGGISVGQILKSDLSNEQIATLVARQFDEVAASVDNQTTRTWATETAEAKEQLQFFSEMFDIDLEAGVRSVIDNPGDINKLAGHNMAVLHMAQGAVEELFASWDALNKARIRGADTTVSEAQWMRSVERLDVVDIALAQGSAVGRALNARKTAGVQRQALQVAKALRENPDIANNPQIQEILMGKLQNAVKQRDGKAARSQFDSDKGFFRNLLDNINTIRINALLSGPTTQEINLASALGNIHLRAVEGIVGGGGGGASRRAVSQLYQTYASLFSGIKAGAKAFRKGDSLIDPQTKIDDPAAMNALQKGGFWDVITLPSRLMLFMDEAIKTSVYKGAARAEVLSQMKGASFSQKRQAIKDMESTLFDPSGKAKTELFSEALLAAQRTTFTQSLEPGSLGHMVQTIAVRYPLARFIMPFVRTPMNIFSEIIQRVPALGAVSKRLRDDLRSSDPLRRAEARGKQVTGVVAMTTAVALTSPEGLEVDGKRLRITGRGPAQEGARRLAADNNWRPYSVLIEDLETGEKSHFEYGRLDPIAPLFGLVADMQEIQRTSEVLGESYDMETAFYATMAGVMNNTLNKTFMTGLNDFIEALSAPERFGPAYVKNTVKSFVPNVLRQINDDPYYREARTIVDGVFSSLPGYSDKLPVKRNAVFEPSSPFGDATYKKMLFTTTRDVDTDPVLVELQRLADSSGDSFDIRSLAKRRTADFGNQDWSEVFIDNRTRITVFDKVLENAGVIKLGGKTYREQLLSLIQSEGYKKAIDGSPEYSELYTTRNKMVKRLRSRYLEAAWRKTEQELPVLQKARRDALRGQADRYFNFKE